MVRPPTLPTLARRLGPALLGSTLLLAGCQFGPSAESQRIEQLEFKIQQLEQRLNRLPAQQPDGADRAGKPPAGVVKSLTLRSGTADDRLRIYWSDGSVTDLPCTKEQATLACG
jgi:outer membrane murein-binding lipoprotein Lpp